MAVFSLAVQKGVKFQGQYEKMLALLLLERLSLPKAGDNNLVIEVLKLSQAMCIIKAIALRCENLSAKHVFGELCVGYYGGYNIWRIDGPFFTLSKQKGMARGKGRRR